MENVHPLRAYRRSAKITQEKLGETLGVTKFAVSKWESGDRNIEPPMAEKIELVTGIDARVLLGIPKRTQKKREAAA